MPALPLPNSNVQWHAALTHFPITLLFVALFFDGISLFIKSEDLRRQTRTFGLWLLTLCVISLPFSLYSGLLTGREYKRAPVGYDAHWQAAVITSVLALLVLVWRLATKDKMPNPVRVIALTLTAASAMGIGYTGHQGGEMVFGGRESQTEVAEAPTPAPANDLNGEKMAIAAGKMEVAAGKLEVATGKLSLAAGGGKGSEAPPKVIVAPAPPVDASPIARAAESMNNTATRFEQIASRLETISNDLKTVKPAGGTPPATVPTPAGSGTAPAATPAAPTLDPKLIAKGEKLFFDEDNFGCTDCHSMNGKGRAKNGDLTHIGSKPWDVEWHIAHLKDPSSKVPGSKMPAYDDKSIDDLRALSVYMVSKK